jgi:hypothetical protein
LERRVRAQAEDAGRHGGRNPDNEPLKEHTTKGKKQ